MLKKQPVSAHERDAKPAGDTHTLPRCCGTQCNHKCFRDGKKYAQILHISGAFAAYWDGSSHFQFIFCSLHCCLSTRRRLLEQLLKRNK